MIFAYILTMNTEIEMEKNITTMIWCMKIWFTPKILTRFFPFLKNCKHKKITDNKETAEGKCPLRFDLYILIRFTLRFCRSVFIYIRFVGIVTLNSLFWVEYSKSSSQAFNCSILFRSITLSSIALTAYRFTCYLTEWFSLHFFEP